MPSLFTRLSNKIEGKGRWPSAASLFLFFFLFVGILGCLPYQKLYLGKLFLTQWFLAGMVAFFYIRNWWLKAFLIWVTLRMVLSLKSLNNLALLVFFSIILALLFYQFIQDKVKREDFLNILCVIALVQVGWVWIQILIKDPLFQLTAGYLWRKHLPAGFMANTVLSGILLAICIPAFFRRGWVWFLPLFVYPFYRIKCITAIFALGLGLFFYLYHRRHIIWPAIVVGPLLWMVGGHRILGFAEDPRYRLWGGLIAVIKRHPIIGYGMGQYRFVGGPIISTVRDTSLFNWSTAHSDPIQLWIDAGIIALLILGGYLIVLFLRRGRDPILSTIVLIGLICSLGFFVFYTPVALLPLGAAALLEKGGRDDNPLHGTET